MAYPPRPSTDSARAGPSRTDSPFYHIGHNASRVSAGGASAEEEGLAGQSEVDLAEVMQEPSAIQ
jgi:hypothetical protein